MRRGHLWVDWVELGCRGWDIDETGAGLNENGEDGKHGNYAHLDRATLHLLFAGDRPFVERVLNALVAAGILNDHRPMVKWPNPVDLTSGTYNTGGAIEAITWDLKLVA